MVKGEFQRIPGQNPNLPQSPPGHELQEKSTLRLRAIFCRPYFIFQEETSNDYGVDCVIELRNSEGQATNYRFHAQLKARRKPNKNKDGSLSLQLETSNLEYLLNHPKSIYVLYDGNNDLLYFEWAEEILRKLQGQRKNWGTQRTITTRFSKLLDESARLDIHAEVEKFWSFERKVREGIARAALFTSKALLIDPEKQTVTSIGEKIELLRENGVAIVGKGLGKIVLKYAQELPQSALEDPKVALACAYAEYQTGRYLSVISRLSTSRKRKVTADLDMEFVEYLALTCEYFVGLLTQSEFESKVKALFRQDTPLSLQNRIEILRKKCLGVHGSELPALLNQLTQVWLKIKDLGRKYEMLNLQAETVMIEVRGYLFSWQTLQKLATYRMWDKIGLSPPLSRRIQEIKDLLSQWIIWFGQLASLKIRTAKFKNPLLLADSIYTEVLVKFIHFITFLFAPTEYNQPLRIPKEGIALAEGLLSEIEGAIRFYENLDADYCLQNAKLLKCQILYVLGRTTEAQGLASIVRKEASAGHYSSITNYAQELTTGKSLYTNLLQARQDLQRQSDEKWYLTTSNKQMEKMAQQLATSLEIPQGRAENIFKEIKAIKYNLNFASFLKRGKIWRISFARMVILFIN